jgi:hypothetical protein
MKNPLKSGKIGGNPDRCESAERSQGGTAMRRRIWSTIVRILVLPSVLAALGASGVSIHAKASTSFIPGDQVKVVNTLSTGLAVRNAPAGGIIVSRKYDGALGTIIAGPVDAPMNGVAYSWWEVRWSDDGAEGWSAGGYPGGVSYLVGVTAADTMAPVITSLSVSPTTVALGGVINFSVLDSGGSGIKQVELWKANDNAGSPGAWTLIAVRPASGDTYSGTFTDVPASAGVWWYGIHAVDSAGNWGAEAAPVRVTIAAPDTTRPTITSLSVSPTGATLGSPFAIAFSVSDHGGSGLKEVELWRANDIGGSPASWTQVAIRYVSGDIYSGGFSDTTPATGAYWYGIHAVDNANNWGAEATPVKVAVIGSAETVSTPTTPNGPSVGAIGQTLIYLAGGSTSSLGHPIQYLFDWGDGTTSGWLALGTTSVAKSWLSASTCSVKAQARCATDTSVVSGWSGILSVTINSPDPALPGVPTSDWHDYKGGRISWRVTAYGIEVKFPGVFQGYPTASTQGQAVQLSASARNAWESYGSLFTEAAKTYGVPPTILLATAVTESSGNADVLGGLMQTSTYNGRYVSARDSIMDAAKNWLGPSYGRYGGDPIFQAVAYNAGSLRIARQYSKPVYGYNAWNMMMYSSDGTYYGSYAWKFAANFNNAVSVVGAASMR